MAQVSLQVPQPEHNSWMIVGIMDGAPLIWMVQNLTETPENNRLYDSGVS
jgi:hypothetical protein